MKILMVSTEYPPMIGGIGRYTSNLVQALSKYSNDRVQVVVACDQKGAGDFPGTISPSDPLNGENLLKVIRDAGPDIVHVQFEPGLYGLFLDPSDPKKCKTYIDAFYLGCKVPIITTFHSAYTVREWLGQAALVKKSGKTGRLGIPARFGLKLLKSIITYNSFHEMNRDKLRRSHAGICFSNYMRKLLGGGQVIYHGSEPALPQLISKKEARAQMSLPFDKKLAVAVGFTTISKGWDILEKMRVPDGWAIVINSSKSHFNTEYTIPKSLPGSKGIVDLQTGFLTDEQLSTLFFACDVVLLPYRITSGSGVMFDALAHGLPFVATDLEFFNEFANMGLGVISRRTPRAFLDALTTLDKNYERYASAVKDFQHRVSWKYVVDQHLQIYRRALEPASNFPLGTHA